MLQIHTEYSIVTDTNPNYLYRFYYYLIIILINTFRSQMLLFSIRIIYFYSCLHQFHHIKTRRRSELLSASVLSITLPFVSLSPLALLIVPTCPL